MLISLSNIIHGSLCEQNSRVRFRNYKMLDLLSFIIVTISVLIIIYIKLINKNPPPVLGVYQRKNGLYWFKVIFMYIVLSLRRLKRPKQKDLELLGDKLEKPQKFSVHEKAIDAVYFNGANKYGNHLIVGMARRKNLLVDGFLFLKVDGNILQSLKLPSTSLYKVNDDDEYAAEGIKITPVEPMKKWRLNYDGYMKVLGNEKKNYKVKIDGIWTSNLPYFNFDTDMDPFSMAKCTAYEKWSRSYFDILKDFHQNHYEQFGKLKLNVVVDGDEHSFELDTIRDHSFGLKREWRQFKRYALHFVSTANGDHFHLGKLCFPISFSRLTIGYIYSAEDDKIYPVEDCDLELYQHGELGNPPRDYAFSFTAGGKQYLVEVHVIDDSPYFYISKNWEAKIYESLSTFKVNGVDGWGAVEWEYRNIKERHAEQIEKTSLNAE